MARVRSVATVFFQLLLLLLLLSGVVVVVMGLISMSMSLEEQATPRSQLQPD